MKIGELLLPQLTLVYLWLINMIFKLQFTLIHLMKVACVRDPLRRLKEELSMPTIPKEQVVDMHQLRNLLYGFDFFPLVCICICHISLAKFETYLTVFEM